MPYKDTEKRRANSKAYYETHHEEIKAKTKAYRLAHREEISAYQIIQIVKEAVK